MATRVELDGMPVSRGQVEEVCRILGYDPTDVSSIVISGGVMSGTVDVTVFPRLPSLDGVVKFQDRDGDGYVKARVRHEIRKNAEGTR
ncbi:hypothetical protein [Brachybacterium paraconglomeratum]|uniref:hypothetical protein n=1 Tax=Brachybacterium paraconglomeratum TaxID=173362 RepID=UPI0022E2F93B|nr:hypothetical protein [Brachybacterium paraconglomeratum]